MRLLNSEFRSPSLLTFSHGLFLTFFWCFLADIATLAMRFKYIKQSYWVHGFLMFATSVLTILTVCLTILSEGGDRQNLTFYLKIHFYVGLAICLLIIFQVILGCLNYIFRSSTTFSPYCFRFLSISHRIVGYSTWCLVRANILIGWYHSNQVAFYIIIAWTLLVFALYNVLVFWNTLLSDALQSIIPISSLSSNRTSVPRVIAPEDFPADLSEYIVFRNMVWDIRRFKKHHPGGATILESVKNRQVDKYLLGLDIPETVSVSFTPHHHSAKALTTLEPPLFQIQYPISYTNLQKNYYRLGSITKYNSHWALLRFLPQRNYVTYKAPSTLSYLGQYVTLSSPQWETLYHIPLVHSLRPENIQFIQKIQQQVLGSNICSLSSLISAKKIVVTNDTLEQGGSPEPASTSRKLVSKQSIGAEQKTIDFLLQEKLYRQVQTQPSPNIRITGPYGRGLCLYKLPPGSIMIFCDGNHILQYLDFFDLLYKQLLIQRGVSRQTIFEVSPCLRANSFSGFKMLIYLILEDMSQIPDLSHLIQITTSKMMSVRLVIKLNKKELSDEEKQNLPKEVLLGDNLIEETIVREFLNSDPFPVGKTYISCERVVRSQVMEFLPKLEDPSLLQNVYIF